jgi:Putative prokaryotic signal transducing protein
VRWPWRRSRSERPLAAPGAGLDASEGRLGVASDGTLRGGGAAPGPDTPAAGAIAGGKGELHLVKVAYAANLPEAELIQGLLRQERIPSMVRRNGGFDVPDFIAAGPRDILVPASQADRARELLA